MIIKTNHDKANLLTIRDNAMDIVTVSYGTGMHENRILVLEINDNGEQVLLDLTDQLALFKVLRKNLEAYDNYDELQDNI